MYTTRVTICILKSSKGIIVLVLCNKLTKSRYFHILQNFVVKHYDFVELYDLTCFMINRFISHRMSAMFFLSSAGTFLWQCYCFAVHISYRYRYGLSPPDNSPDFKPYGFFLWGHMKKQLCEKHPQAFVDVENYVCKAWAAILTKNF